MSLINIALTGAQAAQAALNTTSQNIANVATPGYTRQAAQFVAMQTLSGNRSIGAGVAVPQLIRFSNAYQSQQLWSAGSGLGQPSVAQPYLSQLEQVMGDDNSSISSGLDGLMSALNAATVEPTSTPLRQQVITAADSLGQRIDNLNVVIGNQVTSIHQQRASTVDQINQLSTDVASLNSKIAAAQAVGAPNSALIDARDQDIDKLSSLTGLQVVDQPDGTRSVSLSSGQPLVIGGVSSTMSVTTNANGSQTINLAFAKETFTVSAAGLGGQLGGLDDTENNVLVPLRQDISDIAGQIASKVNTLLSAGYDLNGNPGSALFVYNPNGTSNMMSVTAGVTAAGLGFSSSATDPGNSDQLLGLVDLDNQPITVSSLGTVLLGDADTQLVGRLGTKSQQNQAAQATAQTVRDQAEENWKSTSGVNSDEEAVNLVQYQQMYQANMKVLSVAGTLFDATLQMMGS
jgi:flagellar hook-associated protein 1 FlgK